MKNLEKNVKNTWLAIDPKGVIGEMAFEAAAFDLPNNNKTEAIAKLAAC